MVGVIAAFTENEQSVLHTDRTAGLFTSTWIYGEVAWLNIKSNGIGSNINFVLAGLMTLKETLGLLFSGVRLVLSPVIVGILSPRLIPKRGGLKSMMNFLPSTALFSA